MKRLVALLAVTAIAGAMLVPATQASAAQVGVAVGACQVTLAWPQTGPSSANDCSTGLLPLEGKAAGAFLPGGPVCAPALCDFRASVPYYLEECFADEPPVLGEARGELFLNNTAVADYTWQRVGLVAVIVVDPKGDSDVDAGAGVAAFLPQPPLGTCDVPNQAMVAHVVGAVFAAQAP